jgi:hypothetical protein
VTPCWTAWALTSSKRASGRSTLALIGPYREATLRVRAIHPSPHSSSGRPTDPSSLRMLAGLNGSISRREKTA